MEHFDVIIVGAGVSGLACAHALHTSGLRVVLEASDHIGGRCRTVKEQELKDLPTSHNRWLRVHRPSAPHAAALGSGTFGFEVGAEFVHGISTPLGAALRSHKAPLSELFTWAHGDGGPSDKASSDGGIGMYYLGKEKRLMRFDELDEDFKKMHDVLWSLMARVEPNGERDISDTRSLGELLTAEGVSHRVMGMADAGYANTVGGTLARISAGGMSRCEKNWEHDLPFFFFFFFFYLRP